MSTTTASLLADFFSEKADALRGIYMRHTNTCLAPAGPCSCNPSYQAIVYIPALRDNASRGKVRRSFRTLADAQAWRATMKGAQVTNPLSELRELAERRIADQERVTGDALPHLAIARDYLLNLESVAANDGKFLYAGLLEDRYADLLSAANQSVLPEGEAVPLEKRCPRCGETKVAAAFYKRRNRGKNVLSSYCRVCAREYIRERGDLANLGRDMLKVIATDSVA